MTDDAADIGLPLEQMAHLLLLQQRCNQVVRLVLRRVDSEIPKSMAGLLKLVAGRPMKITELAKMEGLAQPTVTEMIIQAEARGWVRRVRDDADGRVVRVVISPSGDEARRRLHGQIIDVLSSTVAVMPREQIDDLVAAADALLPLIELLQRA